MPQFHFPDSNIVSAHSAELYDEGGEWTGEITLTDSREYQLDVPALLEPTPDFSLQTYQSGIEEFLGGAVSESYRVLHAYGMSKKKVDADIKILGSIVLELSEPYEFPAGVYAATRILELALSSDRDFTESPIQLVTAHALAQITQYSTQSAESLRKDLISQFQRKIGSIGGKADKMCPRLLKVAEACARSIRPDYGLVPMLNWLDQAEADLERLTPDYFGWAVERDRDISKSVITWRAFTSSNPHQKCVKREDGDICECEIGAAYFLRKYVKPALESL